MRAEFEHIETIPLISEVPFKEGPRTTTEELAGKLGLPETLSERVGSYIPSKERFSEDYGFPTIDQLYVRENEVKPSITGANFVMTYNQADKRIYLVPPWHGLNFDPITPHHAGDYGSGVFEGGSLEPVVNNEEIIGANIILNGPRLARIAWSMKSRFYSSPVDMERFDLAMRDLAAILASDVLRDANEVPSRAYIRPAFRPGSGALGLNLKPEHPIQASTYITNWPCYFANPERVYRGAGLTVAAMPVQRLEPIDGKHASNYGAAGKVGRQAANHGVDEAIYFGPYTVKSDWNSRGEGERIIFGDQGTFERNYERTVLADGPGEGLIGFDADGQMVIPPMSVNQLPSTTMIHVARYIAPTLHIKVIERPFCIEDIRSGSIVGMAYVGNAARVAPIGEIAVFGKNGEGEMARHKLDVELPQIVSNFYEGEVGKVVKSPDPNFLTPVNVGEGEYVSRRLKESVYPTYFE